MGERRSITTLSAISVVCVMFLSQIVYVQSLLLTPGGEIQYMFGLPYSIANGLEFVHMYISSERTVAITIEGPGTGDVPKKHLTIPPGSTEVSLRQWSFGYLNWNSIVHNNTFLITSDFEIQIHVFLINNYDTEGFLVLPVTEISTDYLIAAHIKSLYVTLTDYMPTNLLVSNLNASKQFNVDGKFYHGTIDTIVPARSTMQIRYSDPTSAVRVNSSTPVASQTFNQCSYLCTMSIEQFLPVGLWNQRFIFGMLNTMKNYTIRIISSKDNNRVQLGSHGITLHEGQIFEKVYKDDVVITVEATEPVLVLQYSEVYNDTVGGNAMITVPATEQFLPRYTFTVPPGVDANHVTVSIETRYISGLRLDGQPLSGAVERRSPMTGLRYNGYSIVRFPIDAGVHQLTHVNRIRFGAIMYGFGHYRAAYGLPIGLAFTAGKDIIVKHLNEQS